MAFAKAAGLFWSEPVNSFKTGGDVGQRQSYRNTPDQE
jgi:hypothetical protein